MDHLQSYLQHFLMSLNISEFLYGHLNNYLSLLTTNNISETLASSVTSFTLIAVAEIGDKSQLVCMTLASRHRATPVMLGAIAAFAFLNTLAVVFGVAIASWLPEYIVASIVAFLFAAFGIHSLRVEENNDEEEEVKVKSGHGIFFTTFLLITMAEFGDKTQLAVVALSITAAPLAVWFGSTAALASTSDLGILAGCTILQKVPLVLLHKISGTIFLVLSVIAGFRAYSGYTS